MNNFPCFYARSSGIHRGFANIGSNLMLISVSELCLQEEKLFYSLVSPAIAKLLERMQRGDLQREEKYL